MIWHVVQILQHKPQVKFDLGTAECTAKGENLGNAGPCVAKFVILVMKDSPHQHAVRLLTRVFVKLPIGLDKTLKKI